MKYRVLTYSRDDIAHDAQHVANNLSNTCQRNGHQMRVTGVCQTGDIVCFPCERLLVPMPPVRYVIAPISGDDAKELTADLHTRWRSGFTTIGTIDLGESYLGLFATPATPG